MAFVVRHLTLAGALCLLSVVGIAQGGFPTIFLQEIQPIDGVVITNPGTGGGNGLISVVENIPEVENAPIILAQVLVDGPEELTITSINPPSTDFRVELVGSEWHLIQDGPLDYEEYPSYLIGLRHGATQRGVIIEVGDVNDNDPLITNNPDGELNNPYNEHEPPPLTPITKVEASDRDKIDENRLTFEFVHRIGGGNEPIFRMDPTSGELFIIKSLDYRSASMHRLELFVFDSGRRNDSVQITIQVEDLPDEQPEFTQLPTSFTVDENTPLNQDVALVTARDGDLGKNWPIEYILTETHADPNTPKLFAINSDGQILVANTIDAEMLLHYETTLMFDVVVTAREIPPEEEEGFIPLERSATITITIKDLNDNPPEVCIVPNPDATTACSGSQSYTVDIPETHTGELELNLPFIVRDLDSTFSFSQYDIALGPNTDPRIRAGFRSQPVSGSSITECSIAVQSSEQLDYETGAFWWHLVDDAPVPRQHTFDVIFTGRQNPAHIATATINLRVTDVNDNDPIFTNLEVGGEYVFHVCEETPDGTALNVLTAPGSDPTSLICKNWGSTSTPLRVVAEDADITPAFKEIRYSWYSRMPPVAVNPTLGTMAINLAGGVRNFDREMYERESFTIEATDTESARTSRVTATFVILDHNDLNFELRLPQFQIFVEEGLQPTPGAPIANLSDIIASSRDLEPNLDISIKWEDTKLFRSYSSDRYEQIFFQDEDPSETIKKWFAIGPIIKDDPTNVKARLVYGQEKIDRELTDMGVDRVELVIAVTDMNTTEAEWIPGNEVTSTLNIRIVDINDQLPEFEDINDAREILTQIEETEPFPDEGDTSTDAQREIYAFRVHDRDLNSKFSFSIEPVGCVQDCDEYLGLVTLLPPLPTSPQKATLHRTQGVLIDREETKFYQGRTTDELKYRVTVCDDEQCTNSASVTIIITVNDINDNFPIWTVTHPRVNVPELAQAGHLVATYTATDADKEDKFGKITYILDETVDNTKFAINPTSGALTVVGPFEWWEQPEYTVTITATDNYRPGFPPSNPNTTTTIVTIQDANTNAPEFLTADDPLSEPYETWPEVDKPLNETITIRDRDDPSLVNGQFSVRITGITKDDKPMPEESFPFRVGTLEVGTGRGEKILPIIATRNLTGEWGVYVVSFEAEDEADPPRITPRDYTIKILDENLNTPEFIFPLPTNTTSIIINLNLDPGPVNDWDGNPVNRCYAEDKDDPLSNNSRVWYMTVENEEDEDDGFQYFTVSEIGQIILREPLDDTKSRHNLYIRAQDRGVIPRWSESRMTFFLRPEQNRPPYFNDTTPVEITLIENAIGAEHEIVSAFDPDSTDIPGIDLGTIYYFIVGGSKEYFHLDIRTEDGKNVTYIVTTQPLDREFIKEHRVVLYCSNNPTPPTAEIDPGQIPDSNAYLLIIIEVGNLFDTHPQFPQASEGGIISGGFSAKNYQEESIAGISVIDLDDFDFVTFTLSETFVASDESLSNVGMPPFVLTNNTNTSVSLQLTFTPQPTMKGHFTFTITATDLGLLSSTVECKLYMIKESNVVTFTFLNRREEVQDKSARLAEALSAAFRYRCNVDRVDERVDAYNTSVAYTHFIDLTTNEPITGSFIEQLQFNPEAYTRLLAELANVGITLAPDGIGQPQTSSDDGNQLTIYILIGGVGLLGVVLIVLSTSCYFNNRSLTRRVRALTATTFGSQTSGLNRSGAVLDLPNTNEFAIQGSNPMWTTNPGDNEKRIPAFDAESIGSGGSVLIGVEDDQDFKDYKETGNPYEDEDDDLYGDTPHDNQNSRYNPQSYGSSGHEDLDNDDIHHDESESDAPRNYSDNENDDYQDLEMPPPMGFGDTSTRRNPLMDFDEN
ncbi:cadherin-23 [Folsomia candida]|uniref:cadherin-23 n=1 Tax=Folsomia candida TaxID=158441 RepID=UPI000B8FAE83|nr:cadherin-23 [Folsomia candida]